MFELKNDTEMTGAVYDVDSNLNVNLVDAELKLVGGSRRRLDEVYLNGSMIRYVRFPSHVDPMRALDTYLETRKRIARAGTRAKRMALPRPVVPRAIDLPVAKP